VSVYGLDVSNHQGNLTGFGGVATSFLCHKLTEGTSYTDPYAADNLAFARSHAVPIRGGYHYIRSGNGSGEAAYFVARARALFGHDLRGGMWQLDCEKDASWADVKAFKQRWDELTGGVPILFYTGDWWLRPRGWDVASLGFAGLWAAPNRGYVGRADNVTGADHTAGYGGFDRLTLVQYDARASIGDTNVYAGSLAQLRALLAGGNSATEGDDDMPTYTSLSLGQTMQATWDEPTVLRWAVENTDPAHQHADGRYPGFIPGRDGFVDLDGSVRIRGAQPGDEWQLLVQDHTWRNGKSAGMVDELLREGTVTSGDHWADCRRMRYAHDGHHLYIALVLYRKASPADAPAPTIVSGTLRVRQDR
jgi:hypothetical protein